MDTQELIRAVTEASANRQYQVLGALFILVVVYGLRKVATLSKSTGKIATFVNSDLGGVVLSLLTSAAGAAYTMLKNGAPLSTSLVVSAFGNAALASGAFTYGKHARRAVKAMRKPKHPAGGSSSSPAEPPPVPPTTALLPFLLIPALLLSSCAYGKQVLINLEECALGRVPNYVENVTGKVATILRSEGADWESSLKDLGKRVGLDALSCALKSVVEPLIKTRAALDSSGQRAIERGQIYLNKLGV